MKSLALRLARGKRIGPALAWMVTHMSFLIPAERLVETDHLVAFHHPRPSYPLHILILPKRRYASWSDLPAQDSAFLSDLVRAAQTLIERFDLNTRGYRLIVNGGPNQDVPLLHVHLISEAQPSRPE